MERPIYRHLSMTAKNHTINIFLMTQIVDSLVAWSLYGNSTVITIRNNRLVICDWTFCVLHTDCSHEAVSRNPQRTGWRRETLPTTELRLLGAEEANMENAVVVNRKKPVTSVSSDEKLLVGRQEAAAMLSISCRALDYLVSNKQLTTRRIGTRVLIPIADLKRFSRGDHPERLAG